MRKLRPRFRLQLGPMVALVISIPTAFIWNAHRQYVQTHTTISVNANAPLPYVGFRGIYPKSWPFTFTHGTLRCEHLKGQSDPDRTITDDATGVRYSLNFRPHESGIWGQPLGPVLRVVPNGQADSFDLAPYTDTIDRKLCR